MRECQKKHKRRYSYRQRPLSIITNLLALITNPPSQLHTLYQRWKRSYHGPFRSNNPALEKPAWSLRLNNTSNNRCGIKDCVLDTEIAFNIIGRWDSVDEARAEFDNTEGLIRRLRKQYHVFEGGETRDGVDVWIPIITKSDLDIGGHIRIATGDTLSLRSNLQWARAS